MTATTTTRSGVKVVHCRKAPYDVYIGRPSRWGNPCELVTRVNGRVRRVSRKIAVKRYALHLLAHPELIELARRDLRGKVLGCWCNPRLCHGHLLAAIVRASSLKAAFGLVRRVAQVGE